VINAFMCWRPARRRSGRPQLAGRPRRCLASAYITLPPALVHAAASAASVKPWPLQAFWPLQAELALLQALWPLQAFEAPHFTPAAKDEDAKLVAAKTETAVAISIRLFMETLLVWAGDRPA
jgi:hypothetical protein